MPIPACDPAMRRRQLLISALAGPAWADTSQLARHIEEALPDVKSVVARQSGQVRFEYHRGAAQSLHDLQSVTKSVLSMCVGLALAQRRIDGLDVPVLPLLPEPAEMADPRAMRALSWCHLLGLTAGLDTEAPLTRPQWDDPLAIGSRPFRSAPGSMFRYDNHASNLLCIALQRAVGQRASGPQGHSVGALGLQLRIGDLARLGDSMLAEGDTPSRRRSGWRPPRRRAPVVPPAGCPMAWVGGWCRRAGPGLRSSVWALVASTCGCIRRWDWWWRPRPRSRWPAASVARPWP
jgi:CubicO group peptidase (beta-lactamase class C family)